MRRLRLVSNIYHHKFLSFKNSPRMSPQNYETRPEYVMAMGLVRLNPIIRKGTKTLSILPIHTRSVKSHPHAIKAITKKMFTQLY